MRKPASIARSSRTSSARYEKLRSTSSSGCSLPNFWFHATTAYDILRHKGVPLGKRDFLGTLRLKQ